MLTVITFERSSTILDTLWRTSRPLAATALLMIGALAAAAIGLVIDPRTITAAPAWLKPAKFAASFAIYTATFAWVFSLLPGWPRTRRVVGWTTAVVLVLELAIIGGQAYRGTTSHFNVATPLDTVLFAIMGLAIAGQTLTSVAVALALWRQRFTDAALGWALRVGMTLTILGASTGGFMTQPTAAQLDAARAGERMAVAGAHTVGGADGGPGLPGTGWSTQHGDLRVPHFIGLHALQVLPIVALVLARRRVHDAVRLRLTLSAAVSYAALFAILLVQALRGESLIAPGALTATLLVAWAVGTAAAAAAVRLRKPALHRPAIV